MFKLICLHSLFKTNRQAKGKEKATSPIHGKGKENVSFTDELRCLLLMLLCSLFYHCLLRVSFVYTRHPYLALHRLYPNRQCPNRSDENRKNLKIQLNSIHGQLYVALSRCTSFDRISVLLPDGEEDSTTNIVYPEVLI